MKKFVCNLVVFSLFAACFYIVALLVTPNNAKKNFNYNTSDIGYLYNRIRDIDSFQNVQVLILGSSHAYRSFDVRIFKQAGVSAFNLGSSSQTPIQTLQLLREHFSRLKPKLVIFEVNPLIFSMDGVESSLDVIDNDSITPQTWKMAWGVQHLKTWNSLLYASVLQAFNKKTFRKPSVDTIDVYIPGGYVENNSTKFRAGVNTNQNQPISDKQIAYFKKVIQFLKVQNVPVILVQAPVTADFYKSNPPSKAFNHCIAETKLPYYNYNLLLALKDSVHFMDVHHLNKTGARVFNHAFLPVLQKALAQQP